MKQTTTILNSNKSRAAFAELVLNTPDRPRMEGVIRPLRRSLPANNFYWGCIVAPLAEHCGYTQAEMHEELLGGYYGWESREFLGRTRQYPRRRTTKDEKGNPDTASAIDFIGLTQYGQEVAAKLNIILPDQVG